MQRGQDERVLKKTRSIAEYPCYVEAKAVLPALKGGSDRRG